MAKRTNKRATQHADFKGADAVDAAIEKLSKSAAQANAKAGHNSGEVPDEVIDRHIALVEAAFIEWQEKRDEASSAQGVYRNRLKVAKGDGIDKDDLLEAFNIKRRTSGDYVASRRNVGRYLRRMGAQVAEPKGGQGVFDFLDATPTDGVATPAMDAELQGQHAFGNSEERENNPFKAGTDDYVAWDTGFVNAMNASIRKMGGDGAAQH